MCDFIFYQTAMIEKSPFMFTSSKKFLTCIIFIRNFGLDAFYVD